MNRIKVFFANYDYKTRKTRIICSDADLKDDGSAIVHYGVKPFERKAGDYITMENFNNFWRRALEDKAKEISKETRNEEV